MFIHGGTFFLAVGKEWTSPVKNPGQLRERWWLWYVLDFRASLFKIL